VKVLLINKADVNATMHSDTTALFVAVFNGHIEVVKLLLLI